MKSLIIALTLISSASVFAKTPKLCPADTKTILSCVSQTGIPLYPYIAACENQAGESFIALNTGAMNSVDMLGATKVDSEAAMVLTATDEDSDSVVLTYSKAAVGPKATNGVLTYKMMMGEFEDDFRCTLAQ